MTFQNKGASAIRHCNAVRVVISSGDAGGTADADVVRGAGTFAALITTTKKKVRPSLQRNHEKDVPDEKVVVGAVFEDTRSFDSVGIARERVDGGAAGFPGARREPIELDKFRVVSRSEILVGKRTESYWRGWEAISFLADGYGCGSSQFDSRPVRSKHEPPVASIFRGKVLISTVPDTLTHQTHQ